MWDSPLPESWKVPLSAIITYNMVYIDTVAYGFTGQYTDIQLETIAVNLK